MEAVDANRCRTRAVRIAATDASGPPPPAPASQPPGVAMAKQPSFRARPRRSCMRRRSTATTASSSGPASDELSDPSIEPSPSPAMARAVSFAENLTVQEYGMILGDHPGVMDNGPPVTLSWTVQDAYVQQVIDHKNPRRGIQLRIPANLRTEVVSVTASEEEISKASFEVRKMRSQRHTTIAMQEMEGVELFVQSAVRKFQRWQRRRQLQRAASLPVPAELAAAAAPSADLAKSALMTPAEAWLEANTTRRRGKLVLKPGVAPHDASTTVSEDSERLVESPPPVTSSDMAGVADAHPTEASGDQTSPRTDANPIVAEPEAAAGCLLSQIPPPPVQHQRKGSEESQDTAPTEASVDEGDSPATDGQEVTGVDVKLIRL